MQDPVITALHEQVGCYQRLAKLAELQHEHGQQSATEALLDILTRRQEVLNQVSHIEQIISMPKKRWGDYVTTLLCVQRVQAVRLLAETKPLLEEISPAHPNAALTL